MGFFGTVVAFGAGYATGAAFGDKPMNKIREATMQMRDRSAMSSSTVDVRSVTEVMSSGVETVPGDTTLVDATQRMNRANIGDVLVVDSKGMLRGIVTDRDVAIRAVAEGQDPRNTRVGDVMSPPVSVGPEATVVEAMERMREHDIRRLPVVRDGKPMGIVSLGDVSTSSKARSVLADISSAPANK